ncbi:hypothetical protein [Rhizobium sp. Leaf383]|uniref:hypothetical protein n=1 Tax=Rhizobium sp. Leaf383 TaxID=1736357 RepID=UPI000714005D|nr:hypothetical protein [Rhizobium sp. Leaf383]KQS78065.1 hypothetical protein ASG58_06545 [Rhizobium sp. Leaf383]
MERLVGRSLDYIGDVVTAIGERKGSTPGQGGGALPGQRLAPSGFTLPVPFVVTDTGGAFATNYDIQAAKPVYTNTIYVGPGGADANSGLTYALRVRSLKRAILAANALGGTVRILADPATYKYSDVVSSVQASWSGQPQACNLVIESSTPGQKIISLCDTAMPAFVATATDATVYVSTYTTQTPASAVIDMANLGVDTDGVSRPKELTRAFPAATDEATIVAAINAQAAKYGRGAHYLDATNKKLYVKLIANRVPDANLVVTSTGGNANFWLNQTTTSYTVWARDCEFWGCSGGFRVTSSTTVNHAAYLLDCFAGYTGSSHGFFTSGGPASLIMQRCGAACIAADGFNYNGGASLALSVTFIEIDCWSDRVGQNAAESTDASNNGSSAYTFCRGVRVNGKHTNGTNRTIHDIQDSQSWNLGFTAGPSRMAVGSGEARAGFACGLLTFTGWAKMWLDRCITTGMDRDLEAYAGGTLYAAPNCVLAAGQNAPPDGTIGTYAP